MSEAPDTDVIDAEAPEIVTPEPDTTPEISAEDRALTMGWTPREQFKGDPSKWVDAETFVKRGEEYLPFIKANNKRLERGVEKANAEIAKLQSTLAKFAEHNSKIEQRAYERAKRDLESELDAAVSSGDADAVRAVTKDIVELERELPKKAEPKDDGPSPVLTEWVEANPWFEKDRALKGAAIEIAQELIDGGMKDPAKYLPEVAKRIKTEFPHKFENPARRQAGAVEGVGSAPRRGTKTYADLPADAKQMCDEFVRDIRGFTRERFVKDYFTN